MGATTIIGCGCYISSSMFGKREILSVNFCIEHVLDKKVQKKLKELIKIMVDQRKNIKK